MKLLATLRAIASTLAHRSRLEREMEEELAAHIDHRADDLQRRGLIRAEAERRARIEFGARERYKEESREQAGSHFFETFLQDARFGLRMLRKSPVFAIVAILTLALGIGANTAIFSVTYAVLLRPLPYHDAARLIVLNETTPKVGLVSVSYPDFLDWRSQSKSLSQMAAVQDMSLTLSGAGHPERLEGLAVSPNFFALTGIQPMAGAPFDASADTAAAPPAVLLGYAFWQSHFGGDRAVIGRAITLDEERYTVAGIMPPQFRWMSKTDFILPIGVWVRKNPEFATGRGDRGDMIAVARLEPGVELEQARVEMRDIADRIARQYPASNDRFGVELQPVREVLVGDARLPMLLLLGAVSFVLLIACANVANLFLVRGAARSREMALRLALGAHRGRIIRQVLTESLLLASIGGTLGVAVAMSAMPGLLRLLPMGMLDVKVGMDGAVLLFAALVILISALAFGLAPALHSTSPNLDSELREGGGRTASSTRSQNRLRDVLAIAEISLALTLLVGSGLLIRSLYHLLAVDPGFRAEHVSTMIVEPRQGQFADDAATRLFWQRVLDSTRAISGVESAALGTSFPLSDWHSRSDITIENMPVPKPGDFPHPDLHTVSPGYAHTLGIQVLRGREFNDADNETAPDVGLVNDMLARRFFPGQDAIGKRFMFGHPGGKAQWITIVGVLADTRLYGLGNPPRLEVYLPFRQKPAGTMGLLVKSPADPAVMASSIRAAVAAVDAGTPVVNFVTMNQLVSDSVATQRVTLVLLGLFSAVALLLATVGIYGVVSYAVAMRTHEFGIRLALGAQRGDVLRMVMRQGTRLAVAGVAIGLVASLLLTRLMQAMLFGVNAADPATFSAVSVLLVLTAAAACYVPARAAMRLDPMLALRHE